MVVYMFVIINKIYKFLVNQQKVIKIATNYHLLSGKVLIKYLLAQLLCLNQGRKQVRKSVTNDLNPPI